MSGFYWDSANPTPIIEFAVSSSTVTVSTSGVCKVLFPKQGSPGLMQEIPLSGRSYSCNFSTYPNSALCGITEANWASAMPWFVYLVNTNNTAAGVYACITRNPKMSVTPAAAEINDTEAVSASQVQTTINSFTTHDNSTAAVPCICIGSLTMTYATATKKWTPNALSSTDGFGKFQEGVQFTMPVGQNGAQAGEYFSEPAAGDMPDWTTEASIDAAYTLSRNGECAFYFGTTDAGNVTDNGANASILSLYVPYTNSGKRSMGSCRATLAGTVANTMSAYLTEASAALTMTGSTAAINANSFSDAADDVTVHIRYQAF